MFPSELVVPATLCAIVIATCWLLSLVFREYSWVDRIWSIVPPIYVGLFAAQSDWSDPRLVLMTVLTALWGARLTFNYARKGGYAPGGEDYRWAILRSRMSPLQWHAFNLGFIATYQNVLLLLITLPAWTASKSPTPLGALDVALAIAFLAFLAGEFWADQQQWAFHQQKKALAAHGERHPKGFLDTGLWAYSRHPNFFCELAQWWIVYLFAVVASGAPLHATIVGPVLLTLLFHGSARFTEEITGGKYPGYAEHQRRVSRIIPWRPARG
ncbi:DUF1295 domain-containing protein [Myxococcota bacterium]|nr:DUF1295 domain-containing protein [Myxococcota bacterium]